MKLCMMLIAAPFGIAALSAQAIAAEPAIAGGYGVSTCAEFAQEYGRNVAVEEFYFNWAMGFWSGLNASNNASNNGTKDLRAVSQADQKQQIRTYCSEHPLDMYLSAATSLWIRFPTIPHKKP